MAHLSPRDVVPALRADLTVNRPPTGAGAEVIQVMPPGENAPRAMWGFEFSIARMLDGRRTAGEVVKGCERIGLPLDLAALEGFLHQLAARGLLADRAHPGVRAAAAEHRHRLTWSPRQRELYQASLRAAREGELAQAREKLDRLLRLSPGNVEALTLRAWIDEQQSRQWLRVPFGSVLHAAEERWVRTPDVGQPEVVAPPRAPVASVALLISMAVLVALAAAVAMVPMPRTAQATAVFAPVGSEPMFATREGFVDEVLVKEGDWVRRGERLLVWNNDDAMLALAQARAALEAMRKPVRDGLGRTPVGRPLYAELQNAENAVARAQSVLLMMQKEMSGMRFDEAILGYEADLDRAIDRRNQARRAIDALLPDASDEAALISAKSLEVQLLEGQLREPYLRATAAGQIGNLEVERGDYVEQLQPLFTIDDTARLEVVATVAPSFARNVRSGEPLTVTVDGRPYPTQVEKIAGSELTARISNPTLQALAGTRAVTLELEPQALWERLR